MSSRAATACNVFLKPFALPQCPAHVVCPVLTLFQLAFWIFLQSFAKLPSASGKHAGTGGGENA